MPFGILAIGRGGPPWEDMRGPGDAIVGEPGGCIPFVSKAGFGRFLFVMFRW